MKSMVMVFQMPIGISVGFVGTLTGGRILFIWQVVHSVATTQLATFFIFQIALYCVIQLLSHHM